MTSAKTLPTLATVWLDGCSGCHMSLLDTDMRLLDLLQQADLVYSPLVDRKDFPESVDITLVEGAVSSEGDLSKILKVREHTKILVSLGDCAVTANVPSMRNIISVKAVLDRVSDGGVPRQPDSVPILRPQAKPIHNFVKVDVFVPGCPPSADTIFTVITELLAGRQPDIQATSRFGL
ncbi:MAG: NADP oxidoreductase [Cyanobacteria bacterium SZAS LIN-3]|nr:NADP oxidoreductase [Cyanobacteria bacterium SZAS LIN-3]